MQALKQLEQMDKTNWQSFAFQDIAFNISERVEPQETDLEIYVGLEHLDSESIHIRRHGSRDDVKGTKLRFYPGDIIFGRRRAYQRKAAIAKTDGFCSAHALVLRANPEVIDPELFPFFLHSDSFMHRAVDISVGSLSPTINWKTLKVQEFLLPPKDQQARLAELLWATDAVVEREMELLKTTEVARISYINNVLDEELKNSKSTRTTISCLAKPEKYSCVGGPFGSSLTSKDYCNEPGVPIIRGNNLSTGDFKFFDSDFVFVDDNKANELRKSSAFRRDIIVTQRGTLGQVGIIPDDSKYEYYIISQSQMKLTVDTNKAIPEFVYYYLLSQRMKEYLARVTISTGVPHINLGIFKDFPIMLTSIEHQKSIISFIEKFGESIHMQKASMIQIKILLKSIINQVF